MSSKRLECRLREAVRHGLPSPAISALSVFFHACSRCGRVTGSSSRLRDSRLSWRRNKRGPVRLAVSWRAFVRATGVEGVGQLVQKTVPVWCIRAPAFDRPAASAMLPCWFIEQVRGAASRTSAFSASRSTGRASRFARSAADSPRRPVTLLEEPGAGSSSVQMRGIAAAAFLTTASVIVCPCSS